MIKGVFGSGQVNLIKQGHTELIGFIEVIDKKAFKEYQMSFDNNRQTQELLMVIRLLFDCQFTRKREERLMRDRQNCLLQKKNPRSGKIMTDKPILWLLWRMTAEDVKDDFKKFAGQ